MLLQKHSDLLSSNIQIVQQGNSSIIKIVGLSKDLDYEIALEITDDNGFAWSAITSCKSNQNGIIELDRLIEDKEDNMPSMRLLDSLLVSLKSSQNLGISFEWHDIAKSIPIILIIKYNDLIVFKRKIHLDCIDKTTKIITIDDKQVHGVLYLPENKESNLAMICVGGTSSEPPFLQAALLADQGIPALALKYFDINGCDADLTQELVEVPLELISNAIIYLKELPNLTISQIGILGYSKGGELALIAASHYDLHPVIAISPSTIVNQGLGNWQKPKSSWSYQKQGIDFAPLAFSIIDTLKSCWSMCLKYPLNLLNIYCNSLAKARAICEDKSIIPIENINGAVLLISSENDQVWPSMEYCNLGIQRLSDKQFPHQYRHVKIADAGHILPETPLFFPAGTLMKSGSMVLALGGSVLANTRSNIRIQQEIMSELRRYQKLGHIKQTEEDPAKLALIINKFSFLQKRKSKLPTQLTHNGDKQHDNNTLNQI